MSNMTPITTSHRGMWIISRHQSVSAYFVVSLVQLLVAPATFTEMVRFRFWVWFRNPSQEARAVDPTPIMAAPRGRDIKQHKNILTSIQLADIVIRIVIGSSTLTWMSMSTYPLHSLGSSSMCSVRDKEKFWTNRCWTWREGEWGCGSRSWR